MGKGKEKVSLFNIDISKLTRNKPLHHTTTIFPGLDRRTDQIHLCLARRLIDGDGRDHRLDLPSDQQVRESVDVARRIVRLDVFGGALVVVDAV